VALVQPHFPAVQVKSPAVTAAAPQAVGLAAVLHPPQLSGSV
jgi:hypothetical protein